MIWFIFACTNAPFGYEGFEYLDDQETHVPTVEGLLFPTLLEENDSNNIVVLERDAGAIQEMSQEGLFDSWIVEPIPSQFLNRFMLTENGISLIENPEEFRVNETNITSIFMIDNDLHWTKDHIDGTELHSNSGSVLIEQSIDEIEVINSHLYFINRSSKELFFIDIEESIDLWTAELAFEFTDEPRKMTSYADSLYVTTRSTRWPYGGWVLQLLGSELEWTENRLSNSPPEAEHVVVIQDTVYWSSKQSITSVRVDDGTLSMIAPNTTIGGLLIKDEILWWTDSKGGRVFNIPIEP